MQSKQHDLTTVVTEIEQHSAQRGWDQSPHLFALVPTPELLRQNPALASELNLPPEPGPGHLTPVEQEPLPTDTPLDEVLAHIAWPEEVTGCALVMERLMLPPSAEADLPDEGTAPESRTEHAARHPDRQEVRLVVGVLRDGGRECAVRMRAHDSPQDVLTGDLLPQLAEALMMTLAPD